MSARVFVAAALLTLAACSGLGQPQPTAPRVGTGMTETIRLARMGFGEMRRGDVMGSHVWGLWCFGPFDDIHWTTSRELRYDTPFEEPFRDALSDAGFDVVGTYPGNADPALSRREARFNVYAELRSVNLRMCRRRELFSFASLGESGEGTVRIDWAVYSADDGRLVHRSSTTGYGITDHAVNDGYIIVMQEAFADAANALAGDPAFRAAVSRGGRLAPAVPSRLHPAAGGAGSRDPSATDGGGDALITAAHPAEAVFPADPVIDDPVIDDPPDQEPLTLFPEDLAPEPLPPPDGPPPPALVLETAEPRPGRLEDAVPTIGQAVVRVGRGRGVAVGLAGGFTYIVATAAAAGIDAQVAVEPAPGVHLAGAIVARDAVHDLALVRVPARLTALAVRRRAPAVSAPLHAAVKGGRDFASGILARLEPEPDGEPLGLADLTGPAAEAGDPVVDDAGSLVGFALAAPAAALPARQGLTPFTPVGDALRRLGVELEATVRGAAAPAGIDRSRRSPT